MIASDPASPKLRGGESEATSRFDTLRLLRRPDKSGLLAMTRKGELAAMAKTGGLVAIAICNVFNRALQILW